MNKSIIEYNCTDDKVGTITKKEFIMVNKKITLTRIVSHDIMYIQRTQ